jgi:UDP-3-O-[3-hydroxymyristoyl] N-acetylglucosamine deacetylase
MQKTLKKNFILSGITLHSGEISNIKVNPAPANTGVLFKRTDLKVPHIESLLNAKIESVVYSELCTKLSNEYGHSVSTIEHLMSAFHGLGIDNAIVEIDKAELPILDGSSLEYVSEIERVGIKNLQAKRKIIKIIRPIIFRNNDSYIKVTPSNNMTINYTIVYDHKLIKEQNFIFDLDSKYNYKNIISNSRTFGFKDEVEFLREKGLIAGGSLENAIVLDDDGIINQSVLRHDDEFVRHKVLDFIGDIYLLGHRVKGNFEIFKGGHRLTHELVKSIKSDRSNWKYEDEKSDSDEITPLSLNHKEELSASL